MIRQSTLSRISALVFVVLGLAPAAARANEFTVYSCHTPGGAATGVGGWTQSKSTTGGAGSFMFAADTCAASGAGGLVSELPSRTAAWSNEEGIFWTFAPGAGGTIVTYKLQIAGTYANSGATGVGAGDIDIEPSDESDPTYDYRNLGGGSRGAQTIERSPPDEVKSISLFTSCDGFEGPCAANALIARSELSGASVLLNDGTAPKVTGVGGPLTEGKPASGLSEASFEASDSGPGIYAAHFVVDGQTQPTTVLDSNGGLCANLGETTNGTHAFDSPEPCAKSVDGSMNLETTNWADGEHHVQLVVEDASGNSVSAYDHEVSFHNAPIATKEPKAEIAGTPQFDAEEPGRNKIAAVAPATFTAPAGAGAVSTENFWERCNASGEGCQKIAGASGSEYDLTAADVGSTIRYATTGSDKDGSTTSASPQTAVISEKASSSHGISGSENPLGSLGNTTTTTTNNSSSTTINSSTSQSSGQSFPPASFQFTGLTSSWLKSLSGLTRSYPRSALSFTGRLLSPSGEPLGGQTIYLMSGPLGGGLTVIATTKTDPNGNWSLRAPKGPSRLLRIAYGAQRANAAGAQLTRDVVEHVRPTVKLSVSSQGNGVLVFRGKVSFAQISPSLLAVVQALKGHSWQDVGGPARINRRGAFVARYNAAALVGHTYVFRLLLPATNRSLAASSGRVKATVR